MNRIKATVIGGGRPTVIAPTRIGGDKDVPADAQPPAPTTIAPTVIAGTQPAPQAEKSPSIFRPTALTELASKVQDSIVSAGKAATASVMPGSVRRFMEISPEVLGAKFPQASADDLAAVRKQLSTTAHATWGSAEWLAFGRDAQEAVSACIKERLKLLEQDFTRTAGRHLGRLQAILTEVLEAFNDTGFLAKSPRKAWQQNEREVKQLDALLHQAAKDLAKLLKDLGALEVKESKVKKLLATHLMVAEYLVDSMPEDKGDLIASRHGAIMTSQALLAEHAASRELDEITVGQLIEQVNDGVLVKLPALYTQLASLPDKPTNTQRFLLAEQVNALIQLINK